MNLERGREYNDFIKDNEWKHVGVKEVNIIRSAETIDALIAMKTDNQIQDEEF